MINYPADYFKEEIRCGFRITEMMKRNWASQLEVLFEIDRICKKYSIDYFAYAGTLLGAARHKGFVPWDDDIDIAMKRKDYMKLMSVIIQEAPDDFWIKTIYNADDWDNTFGRIVNSKTIPLTGDKLQRFHGAPFATGIDIFPMDYLPKDKELARVQKQLVDLADRMIVNIVRYKHGWYDGMQDLIQKELDESFKIFAEFGALPSSLEGKSIMQIFQLIYDQLCMFGTEDGDECVFFNTIHRKGYAITHKAEWFDHMIDMPFEYGTIRVPVGYDPFLKNCYADYMKFYRYGSAHGYPIYQNQLKRIIDAKMWDGFVDPKDLGVLDEEKEEKYDTNLEKEWKKILADRNMDGKKVVLFENMITLLLRWEDRYLDVLELTLDKLSVSSKYFVWWRPFTSERTPYRDVNPTLFERYSDICKKYMTNDNILYDEKCPIDVAVELSDLYLGDENMIGEKMIAKNKKCYFMDMRSNNPERILKKMK